MLRAYLKLLHYLNEKHYQTAQNPKICDPEFPENFGQRVMSISNFAAKHKDNIIYRPNHGLAHHLRSMAYVSKVLSYYQSHGIRKIKEDIKNLFKWYGDLDKKIILVMAYSSICRESEVGFREQPYSNKLYRKNAGELFASHYERRFEETFKIFKCFSGDEEFEIFKKVLVDPLSEASMKHSLGLIYNTAHKLDLARCFDLVTFQESCEKYIREYSDAEQPYGLYFKKLITYSKDCLQATGSGIVAYNILRENELFYNANSNVDFGINCLSNVKEKNLSIYEIYKMKTANSLEKNISKGFLYKLIGAHNSNHEPSDKLWNNYLNSSTKTPINKDSIKTRIPKNKLHRYQISTENGNFSFEDTRIKKANLLLQQEKEYLSHITPFTYVNLNQGFEPAHPIFVNDDNDSVVVGVALFDNIPKKIIGIYKRDINSYDRPLFFPSKQKAKKQIEYYEQRQEIFENFESLVQCGHTASFNEILVRSRSISAIVIGKDNLSSQILAIYRALSYAKRLAELKLERGAVDQKLSLDLPIFYYLPGHEKNYHEFTKKQQKQAMKKARSIILNDNENSLIKFYLDKIDNLAESNSFIEKNQIESIHLYAAFGELEKLKSEIDIVNINLRDKNGKTPLFYAIQNGQIETVLFLLKQKEINLEYKDSTGRNFFQNAIKKKQKDLVDRLVPTFFKEDELLKFLETPFYWVKMNLLIEKEYSYENLSNSTKEWFLKTCQDIEQLFFVLPYFSRKDRIPFLNDFIQSLQGKALFTMQDLACILDDLPKNQKLNFFKNAYHQLSLDKNSGQFNKNFILLFEQFGFDEMIEILEKKQLDDFFSKCLEANSLFKMSTLLCLAKDSNEFFRLANVIHFEMNVEKYDSLKLMMEEVPENWKSLFYQKILTHEYVAKLSLKEIFWLIGEAIKYGFNFSEQVNLELIKEKFLKENINLLEVPKLIHHSLREYTRRELIKNIDICAWVLQIYDQEEFDKLGQVIVKKMSLPDEIDGLRFLLGFKFLNKCFESPKLKKEFKGKFKLTINKIESWFNFFESDFLIQGAYDFLRNVIGFDTLLSNEKNNISEYACQFKNPLIEFLKFCFIDDNLKVINIGKEILKDTEVVKLITISYPFDLQMGKSLLAIDYDHIEYMDEYLNILNFIFEIYTHPSSDVLNHECLKDQRNAKEIS